MAQSEIARAIAFVFTDTQRNRRRKSHRVELIVSNDEVVSSNPTGGKGSRFRFHILFHLRISHVNLVKQSFLSFYVYMFFSDFIVSWVHVVVH